MKGDGHAFFVIFIIKCHLLHFRNYRNADSPNVKKAKGLIEDLSSIKDQVKTLAEVSLLTLFQMTEFRLFQTERVCRQFQI